MTDMDQKNLLVFLSHASEDKKQVRNYVSGSGTMALTPGWMMSACCRGRTGIWRSRKPSAPAMPFCSVFRRCPLPKRDISSGNTKGP